MTIERLVNNLAASDRALAAALRGATDDEIDALEQLSGQPLPPVYREFLQRMGRGMDWLRPAAASFDIGGLMAHLASVDWRAPPGLLKIGLGDADPFFDIYLQAGGADGGRVVTMTRGPWRDAAASQAASLRPLAGSLVQFIGSAAYRTLRLARFPHIARLTTPLLTERLIDRLPALLAPLRLRSSWFSNDWVQVHDRSVAGIVATQFGHGVLALDIGTDGPARHDAIVAALRAGLGVPLRAL